jgi:hypothetical protein
MHSSRTPSCLQAKRSRDITCLAFARVILLATFLIPANVKAFLHTPWSASNLALRRSMARMADRLPRMASTDVNVILVDTARGGDADAAVSVLRSKGFSGAQKAGSGVDNSLGERAAGIYRYMPAVGMFKLAETSRQPGIELPVWLSPEPTEETLLEARGWGYLAPDQAEEISPFDIEAANKENTYKPAWGVPMEGASRGAVSTLGFNITRMSPAEVVEAASALPQLSRDVLLSGATEPKVRPTMA